MDAEQTHALLNRFFEAADAVVKRYGGRIDKHIGDAVMAVFGAPTAHTDDTERAARAALEMHVALADLESPLAVHIGVASGQVVANRTGSEAHFEYTVIGDSVNLASRLTDLAAPGETYVSDAVQRALGNRFVGEELGSQVVEGFAEPIVVWRLKDIASGVLGRSNRFIGRDRELGKFATAFEACRASKNGETFVLRGDPGIGKTHLLEEIASLSERYGFALYRSFVLDFGAGKGQTSIRALVRNLLDIEIGSEKSMRAQAAEVALVQGLIREENRVHLNNLLDLEQAAEFGEIYGTMDNATRIVGRQEVVSELVAARCRQSPLLVQIEDIHWAEPNVIALLAHLSATISELPCVLVMTTRIVGDPIDRIWRAQAQGAPTTVIELGPLRADEARQLVEGWTEFDSALLETCVDRSGGNPLFLEQLLRNLDELSADNLPGTIQGIVQARLDLLDVENRGAIQAASVFGQRFALDALSFLLGKESVDPSALLRAALVRPAGSNYQFGHALIRDGAYEALLKSRRIELHRRAAEWFEEREPTLHARHLDLAGDEAAPEAYLHAAQRQTELYLYDQALSLLESGLEIEGSEPIRFELTCAEGDVLRALGRSADAIDTFRSAAGIASSDDQICRAYTGIAQVARQADQYEDALKSLEIAEKSAERLNATRELAQIHYLRGNVYFPLGRLDKCLDSNERAIKFARDSNSIQLEVGALSGFGDANYLKGTMRTAENYYSQAVDLARTHDFKRDLAANLHNRGSVRLFSGEVRDALMDANESIEIARKLFNPLTECIALGCLGWTNMISGDLDEAQLALQRAVQIAIGIGAKRFEAGVKADLAHVMLLHENRAAARDLAREGVDIALESARSFAGPRALSALALSIDDSDEQDALLEQGLQILSEGCVSHCHFFLYSDAIAIMLSRADWDAADDYADKLEEFTRQEPLQLMDVTIRQARLLAEIGRQGVEASLEIELDEFRQECRRADIKWTFAGLYDRLPGSKGEKA